MIPLPLLDKVEQELAKMESNGMILKVNQPIPWCAGMVAVPKKYDAIQISVDTELVCLLSLFSKFAILFSDSSKPIFINLSIAQYFLFQHCNM